MPSAALQGSSQPRWRLRSASCRLVFASPSSVPTTWRASCRRPPLAQHTASHLRQLPTACQVSTLMHSLLPPGMLWPVQGLASAGKPSMVECTSVCLRSCSRESMQIGVWPASTIVAVKDVADFYNPGSSIQSNFQIQAMSKQPSAGTLTLTLLSPFQKLVQSMQEARSCRRCFSSCGRTQPRCPSPASTGSSMSPPWPSTQEDAGHSQRATMPGGTLCQPHPATRSPGWTDTFSSLAVKSHPFQRRAM